MNANAAGLCWAVVALSTGLAACRDSGSASPATTPAAPAVAAAAATYVIVRAVNAEVAGSAPSSRATRSTLYVVDPAAPATALQTIDLGTDAGNMFGAPSVSTTMAISVDRAARRYTYNGEAVAFFVKDGKVYKIELRSDLSHEPVQVSSLATACRIAFQMGSLRVSADGRDAWVMIDTAGANGSCAMGATGSAFVRSTMPATAPPLASLPGAYVDTLDDGAQGALGFLISTPAGLELYRPDFSRIGGVDGATGVRNTQWMGYDYSTPQASYFRVDGTMRRLTWTATGATLAAPTHTFTRPDFGPRNPVGHSDLGAFYFADNDKLLKVSGAGQPAEIATIAGLPIYAIFVSDTHLVLWQADPARPMLPPSASVIGKGGGGVVTVKNASVIGTTASRMVYRSGSSTHAVRFDGTGDTVLDTTVGLGSVVSSRARVADLQYLDSYVACVPDAAADRACSNGRIVQTGIDSLSPIDIGRVTHAASYPSGTIRFVDPTNRELLFPSPAGIPTFVGYQVTLPRDARGSTPSTTDLYSWTPGAAGSLARLTSHVP